MKILILAGLLAIALPLTAQKKVVPVTQSPLTGISLPAGSRQDSRGLVTLSARALLEMESKKNGSSIGQTEVLTLPSQTSSGYTADSLLAALTGQGWSVTPLESDEKFAWLQKDNIFLLAYFSLNKNSTDLYFGKANNPPVLAGTMPASGTDAGGNMALPPDAGNNSPADAGSHPPATDPSISGTWYTSSVISNNITHSYIKKQYSFNSNGSYTFYKKTFDISWNFSLLTKESGTYTFNGDQLVISPASCISEKWSKKDRADQWGSLLLSEKRNLEQSSYRVRKEYFGNELNLILTIPNPTERDGSYAVNSSFPNSYFYAPPASADYLISLPGETQSASSSNPAEAPVPGNFSFSSTNWDDGWVSSIEDDKVVVTKGRIKVYVYYPIPYTDAARSAGRDYFWDNYVARQFQVQSKQYQDGGEVMAALQPPYVEGRAIDPRTGQACFLALYQGSSAGIMYPTVVVAPDEASLRQQFPHGADKDQSDIAQMRNYNKFALSLPDLTGNWAGGDFGAMNYYNVYSGNYAGMGAAAMSDAFHFAANGTYSSTHKGASGMVGSMNTYQQEYKGSVTVSHWEIQLSNRREGSTDIYYAYFEAVKGGRVLHLQNKKASAMWYHLVRKQQ